MNVPVCQDETTRIEVLKEFNLLDTAPEACFDSVTSLAARLCDAPISLISLIDEHRQWFKSRVGLELQETPRDRAFCAHAILGQRPLIVPDTRDDTRFADNPLVSSEPYLRFYAGVPLITADGHALGTLCVIDQVPRELDRLQLDYLEALAEQLMAQLELRREVGHLRAAYHDRDRAEAALQAARDLNEQQIKQRTAWLAQMNRSLQLEITERQRSEQVHVQRERFHQSLIDSSPDSVEVLDLAGRLVWISPAGQRTLDIDDVNPLADRRWTELWPIPVRNRAAKAVTAALRGHTDRFEGQCPAPDGTSIWWDVIVCPIPSTAGWPARLLVISRDITYRH